MRDGTKKRLREMEWDDLENLVARLWERRGYETRLTSQNNDKGCDVVATRVYPYQRTTFLQVKSGETTLSSPKVREYAALHNYPHVDDVVIITTTDISTPAIEDARTHNVKLIDCDQLAQIIERNTAFDLIGLPLLDDTPVLTEATPRDGPRTESTQVTFSEQENASRDRSVELELDVPMSKVREELQGFPALRDELQTAYEQLHSELTQGDRVDDAHQSWVGLRNTRNDELIQYFSTGAHSIPKITAAQRSRLENLTEKASLAVIDNSSDYCTVSVTGNEGTTGWDPHREAAAAMLLLVVVSDSRPETVELSRGGDLY